MVIMQDKYEFSFIAVSLRLTEMVLVANSKLNNTPIDVASDLGNGKSSTGKRMLIEFEKRLETLTSEQVQLLVSGDLITQKHIAFLAVCKAYGFIRDFVLDVIREKHLVYDYEITEGEYISFYRNKEEFHLEMDDLTDNTAYKIKQVTFKILEQVGIIDNIKTKQIQTQLLDEKVIQSILNDDAIWLKIFLMSDTDIKYLKTKID